MACWSQVNTITLHLDLMRGNMRMLQVKAICPDAAADASSLFQLPSWLVFPPGCSYSFTSDHVVDDSFVDSVRGLAFALAGFDESHKGRVLATMRQDPMNLSNTVLMLIAASARTKLLYTAFER